MAPLLHPYNISHNEIRIDLPNGWLSFESGDISRWGNVPVEVMTLLVSMQRHRVPFPFRVVPAHFLKLTSHQIGTWHLKPPGKLHNFFLGVILSFLLTWKLAL
jgi:hypothetical protein